MLEKKISNDAINSDINIMINRLGSINHTLSNMWTDLYDTLSRYDRNMLDDNLSPYQLTDCVEDNAYDKQRKFEIFESIDSIENKINVLGKMIDNVKTVI